MLDLDYGTRCPSHVGEAFAVRCYDCEQLAREIFSETLLSRSEEDHGSLPNLFQRSCSARPSGLHKPDVDGYCVLCGGRGSS
jgi:hypothetical protein